MKNICILGSTGSIGTQTLKVISNLKDKFKVFALSCGFNVELLAKQIIQFKPQFVVVPDIYSKDKLLSLLSEPVQVLIGKNGLNEIVKEESVDLVLVATSGIVSLEATLTAIEYKKSIALANKETLVVAGDIVMKKVKQNKVDILPVDSEHNAIFQCLVGENKEYINKIILTASGGPFYKLTKNELEHVTPKQALLHPNWNMGTKITIDSATLMNKGLEVIEAYHLFNLPYSKIEVLIHPQSIIHSMVEYIDGSIKALLSNPDMCLPIQYALSYPDRFDSPISPINWQELKNLTFSIPDTDKFPCLKLAYLAGKIGNTMPAILNGANDKCVELFLKEEISFTQIPLLIEKVMEQHTIIKNPSLDELLNCVEWAKSKVLELKGVKNFIH